MAGCAVARALINAGYDCDLYDQYDEPATGTSAVPCALVRPQVTKSTQTTSAYFNRAFDSIHTELTNAVGKDPDVVSERTGALQLVTDASQWPNNPYYTCLSRTQASEIADVQLAGDALYFDSAGWVDLKSLCRYWLKRCKARLKARGNRFTYTGATRVQSLVKTESGWLLLGEAKKVIDESPLVIIASAEVAGRLPQTSHLPLQRSRGQLSYFAIDQQDSRHIPKTIITGKGSIIPVRQGVWLGSTHDRYSASTLPTASDDLINLQNAVSLCPQLVCAFAGTPAAKNANDTAIEPRADVSWTGVRYSTPDRLPIIGAAPDHQWYREHYADLRHGQQKQQYPQPQFHQGLYLATGFGSRGVLHSVYASDTLATIISGDKPPPAADESFISALLHPGRFIVRQLRRG